VGLSNRVCSFNRKDLPGEESVRRHTARVAEAMRAAQWLLRTLWTFGAGQGEERKTARRAITKPNPPRGAARDPLCLSDRSFSSRNYAADPAPPPIMDRVRVLCRGRARAEIDQTPHAHPGSKAASSTKRASPTPPPNHYDAGPLPPPPPPPPLPSLLPPPPTPHPPSRGGRHESRSRRRSSAMAISCARLTSCRSATRTSSSTRSPSPTPTTRSRNLRPGHPAGARWSRGRSKTATARRHAVSRRGGGGRRDGGDLLPHELPPSAWACAELLDCIFAAARDQGKSRTLPAHKPIRGGRTPRSACCGRATR